MRTKLILLFAVAMCLFLSVAASAQSYAIANAKIVTVSGATIEKGTIVIRNGLIEAVGANVATPADAQVFDATGLTVYPGFFDALTSLGLQTRPATPAGGGGGGPQAAAATQAQPTSNSNYPAGLRPEDMTADDLRSGEAQFEAARNTGFTTVLTVGRNGIFNGQSAVINLAGESVSSMTLRSPYALHITYTTLGQVYPQSLLGTFSAIRQMFYDAKRLEDWQKAYAANTKGLKRPDSDKSLEALFPYINGKAPVVFNANTEREIIRSIDLIKEFKLNGVIAGGQEAWKVSDRLKANNIPVLLSLNFPKRTTAAAPDADPESMEVLRLRAETPKGAGKLAAAGVKFAFQSGGATTLADFFTNAGKAVENGLSKDAAIRAMTLGAAEILGVDNRLGSIEAGKIANLAIVKGDVFSKDRFVSQTIVDGKVFEQKEPPKPAPGRGNGSGSIANNGSTPAVANVGGAYSVTIDIPGQPLPATLTFVQQGSTFTGTMVSQLGTTQIRDGKVTADGFSFSGNVEFGGTTIAISVSGRVTGNQVSGTIDSPQGVVPFSGNKNP